MSAVPVNDDERPLGLAAFSAVRTMPGMSTPELHVLLGHLIGHLVDRQGSMVVARTASIVLTAARKVDTPLTLAEIAFGVAAKYDVSVADLCEPSGTPGSKTDAIARPRQEAYWLARQQRRPNGDYRHSLPAIGKFFGGRDHTTVLYGVRRHAERLLKEPIA